MGHVSLGCVLYMMTLYYLLFPATIMYWSCKLGMRIIHDDLILPSISNHFMYGTCKLGIRIIYDDLILPSISSHFM